MNDSKITLIKLANKHKISTKILIDYFVELDLLKRKNKWVESNSTQIIVENKIIFISKNFFYHNIAISDSFSKLLLSFDKYKPIHEIKDEFVKINELNKIVDKKLLFLDFEFICNQYYEVAFQVVNKGIVIQKGYFFEEKTLQDNFIFQNGQFGQLKKINKKIEILEKENKNFNILNRNLINLILSNVLIEVDYVIAHNINSELSILKNNNILFPLEKTICTEKLFSLEIKKLSKKGVLKPSNKLKEISDFFNLKTNISQFHYAYYDVEILKQVFFNIIKYFNNKKEINE